MVGCGGAWRGRRGRAVGEGGGGRGWREGRGALPGLLPPGLPRPPGRVSGADRCTYQVWVSDAILYFLIRLKKRRVPFLAQHLRYACNERSQIPGFRITNRLKITVMPVTNAADFPAFRITNRPKLALCL